MTDEVKMSQIKKCASVIASIIMQPEVQPALEILIISSWAYIEALADGKVLMNNKKVPFIKTSETWQTDIKYLWNGKQTDYISNDNGLHYNDYLKLLLYFTNIEELTFRLMDLIEMDVKNISNNPYFRMYGCIDYIEAIVTFISNHNYEVIIKREKQY